MPLPSRLAVAASAALVVLALAACSTPQPSPVGDNPAPAEASDPSEAAEAAAVDPNSAAGICSQFPVVKAASDDWNGGSSSIGLTLVNENWVESYLCSFAPSKDSDTFIGINYSVPGEPCDQPEIFQASSPFQDGQSYRACVDGRSIAIAAYVEGRELTRDDLKAIYDQVDPENVDFHSAVAAQAAAYFSNCRATMTCGESL